MGVYERLGVETIINAWGNATLKGGSIMRPEVLAAMEQASRSYVRMPELLEKAGRRVAELAGVEAAYISSGAAAGIAISVAACMTGEDYDKMHQLPDTTGMKNEVIVQAVQIGGYDNMIELAGARVIPVGDEGGRADRGQMEEAFNEQTLAVVHFVAYSSLEGVPIEEVIEISHKRGVPVIVDAAAEFPPFSVLRLYADMGADLTIFSGGKGLLGPQASGLVLGRKGLIEACAVNTSPNHGVGRPMKIGKEEIIGLVTALELYADEGFQQAERRSWEERTSYLAEALSRVPGVRAYNEIGGPTYLPDRSGLTPEGIPITYVEWDAQTVSKAKEDVERELDEGSPSMKVGISPRGISISPHTLQPGEERIIAERVARVLSTREQGATSP